MKIIVGGLTASGKSWLSQKVADHFGLQYVSGSETLQMMARHKLETTKEWLSAKAKILNEERAKNHDIDRRTDDYLLKVLQNEDDLVVDSWTMPWLYTEPDVYKVYMTATLDRRAKIAYETRRDENDSLDEMRIRVNEKDMYSVQLFKDIYNIDITDTSVFDLVFDIKDEDPSVNTQTVIRHIEEHFSKNN